MKSIMIRECLRDIEVLVGMSGSMNCLNTQNLTKFHDDWSPVKVKYFLRANATMKKVTYLNQSSYHKSNCHTNYK